MPVRLTNYVDAVHGYISLPAVTVGASRRWPRRSTSCTACWAEPAEPLSGAPAQRREQAAHDEHGEAGQGHVDDGAGVREDVGPVVAAPRLRGRPVVGALGHGHAVHSRTSAVVALLGPGIAAAGTPTGLAARGPGGRAWANGGGPDMPRNAGVHPLRGHGFPGLEVCAVRWASG